MFEHGNPLANITGEYDALSQKAILTGNAAASAQATADSEILENTRELVALEETVAEAAAAGVMEAKLAEQLHLALEQAASALDKASLGHGASSRVEGMAEVKDPKREYDFGDDFDEARELRKALEKVKERLKNVRDKVNAQAGNMTLVNRSAFLQQIQSVRSRLRRVDASNLEGMSEASQNWNKAGARVMNSRMLADQFRNAAMETRRRRGSTVTAPSLGVDADRASTRAVIAAAVAREDRLSNASAGQIH